MKHMILAGLCLSLLSACSVQNMYAYPEDVQNKYVITTGDTDRSYESLGYIQITKTGATLFGFWDVNDADLEGMFSEALLTEIDKAGADGVINLHFHETQYTDTTRSIFAVLFVIPLPRSVTVTAELVKFK